MEQIDFCPDGLYRNECAVCGPQPDAERSYGLTWKVAVCPKHNYREMIYGDSPFSCSFCNAERSASEHCGPSDQELLDRAALAAMQGLIAADVPHSSSDEDPNIVYAELAWDYAEAWLAERKKRMGRADAQEEKK